MQELHNLEVQVRDVDSKVTSILVLLKGHDMDKEDKGMIGELKDHEHRLIALEKMKDRMIYFLIGLSIPAGWGIVDIFNSFLSKP